MSHARFVTPQGDQHELDVPDGENLKQAAIDHMVPGIIGDCGGFSECGTCHGYVDEAFAVRLPEPDEDESFMLEGLIGEVRPTSRLTCQIVMSPELDGITVTFPDEQG